MIRHVGLVSAVTVLMLGRASAATYVVPDNFRTVARAAEVAVSGDSIEVMPGMHTSGGFVLRSGVVLRGVANTTDVHLQSGSVVISAQFGGLSPYETVIENMTIEGPGIYVYGVSNVRIQNNRVLAPTPIQGDSPITVYDNELWGMALFEKTLDFIDLASSQPGPMVFVGNRVWVHEFGVNFSLDGPGVVTEVTFEHNTIVASSWSQDNDFDFGMPAVIRNNIFQGVDFVVCPPAYTTFSHNLFSFGSNCTEAMDPSNIIMLDGARLCDELGFDWRVEPESPAVGAADDGGVAGALGVGCAVTAVGGPPSKVASPAFRVVPNPAPYGSRVTLLFDDTELPTDLEVFDVAGRSVATLPMPATVATSLDWNLHDMHGRKLAAGVYFVTAIRGSGPSRTPSSRLVILP